MSNQVSEIEEKRVWGIHTKDDNLFLKENVIALGWQQIGDLSLIAPDRESFKEKYIAAYPDAKPGAIIAPVSKSETDLALTLCRFNEAVYETYEQKAPNRLCRYIYDLTAALNQFYVEHNIMKEPDPDRQAGYIALIKLVLHVLEPAIDLLGFSAPERM